MSYRSAPRALLLLALGCSLPWFAWQASVSTESPYAWPHRLGPGASDTARCGAHMRMLGAAVEMYQLDYNLVVADLTPAVLGELVHQGYLREVLPDPGFFYDSTEHYVVQPRARYGVTCLAHGDGDQSLATEPAGPDFADLALPYAGGVLMTLLFQGLLAWRRSRGRVPEPALEWFHEPAFRPATKETIAALGSGACCPVCAQHLVGGAESMVECLRCATPHHLDCAGYTDRCGVYACGEAPPEG